MYMYVQVQRKSSDLTGNKIKVTVFRIFEVTIEKHNYAYPSTFKSCLSL